MIFYICLFLFVVICSQKYRGININAQYLIISTILTLVVAIRFDVGIDYYSYYNTIDNKIIAGLIHYEPICLAISLIAIYFNQPFLFFIITSIIIYPIAFYTFKKYSVDPFLSIIVYIGLFYLISCSIVRQSLALSLCIFAYKYLVRKSLIKYIIVILVASLCHSTALVAIIIYPVFHYCSCKLMILLLSLAFIIKGLIIKIMITYGVYTVYLSILTDLKGGALTRLFYVLLLLSVFIIIKIKGFNDLEKKHISVILIGLFCPFIFGSSMGERIGYYFLAYFCFLLPLLLKKVSIYKRYMYILIFFLYYMLTIYITSASTIQKSAYTPYKTIFNIETISFK